MKSVINWAKEHPTQAVGVAMVVIGWLALFHVPAVIITGLGTIVGIVSSSVVHNAVTPVTTAAAQVTQAATEAATQVTEQLTSTTVGSVDEITEPAKTIVNNTIDRVVGGILGK